MDTIWKKKYSSQFFETPIACVKNDTALFITGATTKINGNNRAVLFITDY